MGVKFEVLMCRIMWIVYGVRMIVVLEDVLLGKGCFRLLGFEKFNIDSKVFVLIIR